MSSHNPPPWLSDRRRPPSNLPSKRPADSRAQERPSKRSAPSTTAQEEAWVADEDRFVLQQAKKKAALRVKGNRAKPIDWLTVTLRFVDPTKTILDEEVEDHELDIVDSEGVIESLDEEELAELEKDIDTYLALETNRSNRDYWNAQKTICKDKRRRNRSSRSEARGTSSITSDIDRLLSPKSFEELETLEVQVKKKLDSDEPIDYDYWEQLLRNLRVWKAKAKLKKVSQQIINERLEALRRQQEKASVAAQEHFRGTFMETFETEEDGSYPMVYDSTLDPEPMLKLRPEDKSLEAIDDKIFSENLVDERRKILKLGYVPMRNKSQDAKTPHTQSKATQRGVDGLLRFAPVDTEDHSKATTALYEREVARGVEDGEEVFTGEEELNNTKPQWSGSYAPRKPRYFNRVQMGYEWNKYNQTHYDHDNPPPKVVQGYKFNIFYPDLIDKSKAPTYKIVRENGRKRGQSFAAAGEDDTCLIRFIAGPPYEDIAFRIVDKEWDYSAKRERGFKSSFDKGILQLHFQFKKIYYRK